MNNSIEEYEGVLKKVNDASEKASGYICSLLMTREKIEHLKSIGVKVDKRLYDYEHHLEVTIKEFLNLK